MIKSEIINKLDLDPFANANEKYEILSKIITESKDKHIPKKFVKGNTKKDKWITNNLLSLVNQKKLCIEIGNQQTMLMSIQRKVQM